MRIVRVAGAAGRANGAGVIRVVGVARVGCVVNAVEVVGRAACKAAGLQSATYWSTSH